VRSGEIKALTGLRILAAVWVVLFHFRPLLRDAIPGFRDALAPVLNCGAQGVDLFFILSGFVLTWNYLDRMGGSWSARATLHFLSQEIYRFTAISYVRQVLLMQLWFQPFFDNSSWDGPAWSISAEWLAYLLFGLLVLVIFRMARATRARRLMWLAVGASLPPVVSLLVTGQFYTPWSWLPRIVMQFTAGALVAAAVGRLQPTDRARRVAGYASVLLIVGVVGFLYWSDAHPLHGVTDTGGLVDILFVPLVMTLAIGTGSLPALLSTRPMVYGGQISFCLYMVHELAHTSWIWTAEQFQLTMIGNGGKLLLVAVLALTFLAAAVLYHIVEEPARRWMRRMVGDGRPIAGDGADPAAHVSGGKLQSIDGFQEGRPKSISARAG
jgi:peptidoglycan/LPS O-acetylase OafA/YrhL